MADFVAVLKKTIDAMADSSPEMRRKVYEKARATIAAKLAALDPPPPQAASERQMKALEDAIAMVEAGYAAPPPRSDPLAELDDVFASIDRARNEPVSPRRPAEPAAPQTSPQSVVPPPVAEPEPHPERIPVPGEEPTDHDREEAASEAEAHDYPAGEESPTPPRGGVSNRRRPQLVVVAAAAVLALAAVGAYSLWQSEDVPPVSQPNEASEAEENIEEAAIAEPVPESTPESTEPDAEESGTEVPGEAGVDFKFTQRLNPDGTEIDAGRANEEPTLGEGTSVAAITRPGASPPAAAEATESAEGVDEALPVGQRAIFYEERTSVAQGSAETGAIVWSLVQESPGANLPPEPAIRAEATIPGKDVQLRMTIRRNADETLPASHIVEMIFLTPEGFEGGGIDNVLRIALKSSEEEAGNPLIGIPAKIADGYFLVALNDSKAEMDANMALLRRQSWIDVPLVYKSGRRALITMEKGVPGAKVFEEAMRAWEGASG